MSIKVGDQTYPMTELTDLSLRLADRLDGELEACPEVRISGYAEAVQLLAELRADAQNLAVELHEKQPNLTVSEALEQAWKRFVRDRRLRVLGLVLAWASVAAGGGQATIAEMYDGTVPFEEVADTPVVPPKGSRASGRRAGRPASS